MPLTSKNTHGAHRQRSAGVQILSAGTRCSRTLPTVPKTPPSTRAHVTADSRRWPAAAAAYTALGAGAYRASALTRGPWDAAHQHAGPPIALLAREILALAATAGYTRLARITANLLRPVPLARLAVRVEAGYAGRAFAHYGATLLDEERELVRATALVRRASDPALPEPMRTPQPPATVAASAPEQFPFADAEPGYHSLVEARVAAGRMFSGPCAVWLRMRHPLVAGETPGGVERALVAADSANGVSAVLDYRRFLFVNSDLTVNFLREPAGEWICLDAETWIGPDGGGLAEGRLYDEEGLVGRCTQSLAVRRRESS